MKHFEMRRMDRHDDTGAFASLVLMDRNGVCENIMKFADEYPENFCVVASRFGVYPTGISLDERYREIRAKQIAPDLAVVACWVRHDMKLRGPMKATGGDARVMSVFRKKPEGWRFIAYAEGPMSPVLFMHKLYEMNVSPGFDEFNRNAMEARKNRDG